MYVGTIIEYDDQSAISTLPISTVASPPLFLALFTSDKGPEEWTVLSGSDWFNAYGNNISYDKHGQPLLQAAITINAGARLLSKRLVAQDASLANLSIVATVAEGTVQEKDESGNLLYLTEDGTVTTEVTDTPKNITTATIKYECKTVESYNSTDPKAVFAAVKEDMTADQYLLYTITDVGRGLSNKRIMIIPNYKMSKAKRYVEYTLSVAESGSTLESMTFNPVPDRLIANSSDATSNYSLQSVVTDNSVQIKCVQNDDGLTGLIEKIAEITGRTVEDVESIDFLFGYTKAGAVTSDISVDADGVNLQNSVGLILAGGSNGSFGDAPISAENEAAYCEQAEYALGTDSSNVYDTGIFDQDRWKIDLCVDANYPAGVKRAIENLVTYREDFSFMRDLGLGLNNFDAIKVANDAVEVKNKFISTYSTTYDVIDPYTKKQIPVTIGFTMARLMVGRLNANRILPVCGIKYGLIIDDAIKGTVNFCPVVCPDPLGDQKTAMEDIRVNYATYIGNDLVVETEYTSQDAYTQFSFLSNILATQEVVRDIRTRCPVIRYSFIEGEDLNQYKSDINVVISKHASKFKTLKFDYVNDETYINNKIFYAAIQVGFRNFIQTEWFKVTAINVSNS